jgi:hypothetical protein
MLIFLGVMLSILIYGSYRCVRERSFSYFHLIGGLITHTLFKGNKIISAILWVTLACSVVLSNLLGPRNINFSIFNPLSHFLFGFLASELFKISNDYYPYIDKFASKFPDRIAKHINPTTFAFVLCMGNGIQEEIQKAIPKLKSLVWTNLKDQITDAFMDTAGIIFSTKRADLFAVLKQSEPQQEFEAHDTYNQ